MTFGNVQLNPAFQNHDVQGQVKTSQNSAAANTISAKFPHQVNPNSDAKTQNQSNNLFATLTQAYKDSYDKYQKDKGTTTFSALKSLFKLDQILETEDYVTNRQEENATDDHQHQLEYLA
jgi:hypothetical protein